MSTLACAKHFTRHWRKKERKSTGTSNEVDRTHRSNESWFKIWSLKWQITHHKEWVRASGSINISYTRVLMAESEVKDTHLCNMRGMRAMEDGIYYCKDFQTEVLEPRRKLRRLKFQETVVVWDPISIPAWEK